MLETEFFRQMLRGVFEDMVGDPSLSDVQGYVRCRALMELLDEVEALIRQNCRKDKLRGTFRLKEVKQ